MSGGATLRLSAAVSALLGLLLLLGTWDGLYSRLDLPQALPALGPQIGGLALLGLGYLLWSADSVAALQRPVSRVGAVFYLASAAVIAAWLIFRDKADLGVGDTGWVVLIVTAVVFALLGVALLRVART